MKETRQNTKDMLLKVGKEEFLEKGYAKASLRTICKKAGITTGAVYFFFENKEDLFCKIVKPFLVSLEKLGRELARAELEDTSLGVCTDMKLMEFLWRNRTEAQLLFEKSAGTRYENFKDEVLTQLESSFSLFFQKYGNMGDDKNLIRVLVKMRIKGFIELIKEDYSLEEMLRLTERIGCYADGGFQTLMREYGENQQIEQYNKVM